MSTVENGNNKRLAQEAPPLGGSPPPKRAPEPLMRVLLVSLRVGVLLATAAAALLIGLNRQTRTMVVAVVGNTPISQTLVAKFYHTRAFIYFVVANAMASAYNLLVLLLRTVLKGEWRSGFLVDIADKVVLVVVATGAAAAAAMAELAKNGNPHARWFPICDKFDTFCHRGGAAIVASFLGAALLLLLSILSAVAAHRKLAVYEYSSM